MCFLLWTSVGGATLSTSVAASAALWKFPLVFHSSVQFPISAHFHFLHSGHLCNAHCQMVSLFSLESFLSIFSWQKDAFKLISKLHYTTETGSTGVCAPSVSWQCCLYSWACVGLHHLLVKHRHLHTLFADCFLSKPNPFSKFLFPNFIDQDLLRRNQKFLHSFQF